MNYGTYAWFFYVFLTFQEFQVETPNLIQSSMFFIVFRQGKNLNLDGLGD